MLDVQDMLIQVTKSQRNMLNCDPHLFVFSHSDLFIQKSHSASYSFNLLYQPNTISKSFSFMQVSIDKGLLSPELRSALNPLIIDIKFAKRLPSLPNWPEFAPTTISYEFPAQQKRTREGTLITASAPQVITEDTPAHVG